VYHEGDTFEVVEDAKLVAQWKHNFVIIYYTVTYDGTTFTGGDVPVDRYSPYVSGSVVVVLSDGNMVKDGYVFLGWDTNEAADTVVYVEGSTFNLFKDTVLYAVWQKTPVAPTTYTVTYVPGDHGTFTAQVYPYVESGAATPVFVGTPSGVSGYTFAGWVPTVASIVTEDVTYVAQWTAINYRVTYNAGGGTGAPTDNTIYHVGDSVTVSTVVPTRDGYTFAGWLYAGSIYRGPSTTSAFVMPPADVTLTAQWTAVTPETTPGSSGGSTTTKTTPKTSLPAKTTPSPTETSEPTITPPPKPPELPVQTWALVNLIISIVGVIFAILATIGVLLQRNQKQKQQVQTQNAKGAYGTNTESGAVEVKKAKQRRLFWYLLSVIMGVVGVIVFLLTEDMSRTMALVDWWTIVNAVIFIVEVIAIVLIFKREKKKQDNDAEQQIPK
jgi:uncharacterized repeat protein (TIGR02543 family)